MATQQGSPSRMGCSSSCSPGNTPKFPPWYLVPLALHNETSYGHTNGSSSTTTSMGRTVSTGKLWGTCYISFHFACLYSNLLLSQTLWGNKKKLNKTRVWPNKGYTKAYIHPRRGGLGSSWSKVWVKRVWDKGRLLYLLDLIVKRGGKSGNTDFEKKNPQGWVHNDMFAIL